MTSSAHRRQQQLTAAAKTLEQYPAIDRLTDEGLSSLTTEQLLHLQQQINSVLIERADQQLTSAAQLPQPATHKRNNNTPKPQPQPISEVRKQYELLAQQQRKARR